MNHYAIARINKDKNYDGRFFFGVKTTGIFCRPSCPAPVAKEKNVLYFNSVFSALEQKFTPCYRCRPDLDVDYYNGNAEGTLQVSTALDLIFDGYLNTHPVSQLAKKLAFSERHLRKLFQDNLGVAPNKIALFHRALFAKKLITTSKMAMSEIVFASGFRSIRQFNETIKNIFGKAPTTIRMKASSPNPLPISLQINYKQPFHFPTMLNFMRPRAITGVEQITHSSYSRTFRTGQSHGMFSIVDAPDQSCLNVSIKSNNPACYMELYNRIKNMFDIDTNMKAIEHTLKKDRLLVHRSAPPHLFRIPKAFDAFEFVIRAILGQQISVKAATTYAARIAQLTPVKPAMDTDLTHFFPTPAELLTIDLSNIGLPSARQETIRRVIEKIVSSDLKLDRHQSFENFYNSFCSIKGIGDWTAHYVGMRALGFTDCFPVSDLGIIKALTRGKKIPTKSKMLGYAEKWRPYRSYATLCLWNKETNTKKDNSL